MDETKLICPYCGASYQARDSTCPRCGKALSPTGYAQYGEPELPEQPPAQMKPAAAIVPPIRTGVAGIDRPRSREARIDAWRYYLPIAVILVLIASFFILNGQSRHTTFTVVPPPVSFLNTPMPVRPFACLPPPEATLYPVIAAAAPTDDALPHVVSSAVISPPPDTTPIPATNLTISYILTLTTTKGVLQAKMYDIGATFSNLPPVDRLTNSRFGVGSATVTINTNDLISADFTPNNLPYRCGSLLLPVRDGKVGDDELSIITSDDPSSAILFTKSLGYSYVVVGQLVSGYDVLGALTDTDSVTDASSASKR